jgi:preprotein translocase subunit SecE
MGRLTEYLRNVRAELAKVSWPSRHEVASATLLVVVLSIAVSLFVALCDFVLNKILAILL